MARVVRFHEHGGPEVLRIEAFEPQPPGRDEVRIRVKALGLNRAEALLRAGTYIETPVLPSGLGLEAAGIVDALGEGVRNFVVGDVVSIIPPISMVRWPTYGDLVTFPESMVVKHPARLDFVGAAALWMAYLTAYGALIGIAGLKRGDFIVITAASSSVGLAAIQMAKLVGAVPIAVTRNSVKKQALLDSGAAEVIASSEEDLQARLEETAGKDGVRVVFDAIGGPIFQPLTAAMSCGGILIEYGGLSAEPTPFPLFEVLAKRLTLRGYLVHEITGDPARLAEARSFIADGVERELLKPVVARTVPFEEIAEAHRFLESNAQFGKIVVTV